MLFTAAILREIRGQTSKNSEDLMSVYKEGTLLCATVQLLCADEKAIS